MKITQLLGGSCFVRAYCDRADRHLFRESLENANAMTTISHANPKRNDPLANPTIYGLGALVCCGLWRFKGAASGLIDKHIESQLHWGTLQMMRIWAAASGGRQYYTERSRYREYDTFLAVCSQLLPQLAVELSLVKNFDVATVARSRTTKRIAQAHRNRVWAYRLLFGLVQCGEYNTSGEHEYEY